MNVLPIAHWMRACNHEEIYNLDKRGVLDGKGSKEDMLDPQLIVGGILDFYSECFCTTRLKTWFDEARAEGVD